MNPAITRQMLRRSMLSIVSILSGLAFGLTEAGSTELAPLPGIVINEVYYDPPDKTQHHEFIELFNAGAASLDLSGWRIEGGVGYRLPAGTSIPPGGYLVVAENPAAFRTAFGFLPLGPWEGALSNEGEAIQLENAAGEVVDEVDYGVGFPWPTDPHGEGASMELLHPALDNNLGGSWRASSANIEIPETRIFIAPADEAWRYRKGTSEPEGASGAWRLLAYTEEASWSTGQTSIGYGDGDDNTTLSDMANNYTTVYLRHRFTLPVGGIPPALQLNLNVDDGAVAWINGVEVARINVPAGTLRFDAQASAATEPAWQTFLLSDTSMLRSGENQLAIHAVNQSAGSSDLTIDAELRTPDPSAIKGRPSPGQPNSVLLRDFGSAPPQIRQVTHFPSQPTNGQAVTITARITDPDGVGPVRLAYQVVDPGRYLRKSDAAYASTWTELPMTDDGAGGDSVAGDSIYSVQLPASLQVHRRLVRYRMQAQDVPGHSVLVPYLDDQSPNFAYFVYNAAPGWRGASRPGTTPVLDFPPTLMNSLPIYHLIANQTDVSNSQWNGSYDTVRMWGTLVYDGEVYDHIQFHNRGEGSTYNTGKNKWRFHFNRARDFQPRDFWGRRYRADWKTMNFDACASPWASVNRGMAGLDEGISYRLYELAGVPSSKTHYLHFRVIDNAIEASSTSQYDGDLWGLYQAIEQPDGRFLDERELPDGNVYKIEGGGGDKKNQGPTQSRDTSDWNAFRSASGSSQTESWWRTNMDMPNFFSFHAMNRVTGNVDLRHGANHYFYHRPDGRWAIMPWDMDMMFLAETHWPGIVDQNAALSLPGLALGFKNRCREILDLMCSDARPDGGQIGQLVDEFAQVVNPAGEALTWADVDEFMWNWNPRSAGDGSPSGQVNHRGNFYKTPYTDNRFGGTWVRRLASSNFEGFAKFILDYCTDTDPNTFTPGDGDARGYGFNYLELEARDTAIPNRPTITYAGLEGFPANGLRFRASAFSDPQGAATFGAMKWRISEISHPSMASFVAGAPRKYELEPGWESPELTAFAESIDPPVSAVRPGGTYRARVRMMDNTGRWSHWSEPVQFVAGEPNAGELTRGLVISEILYAPGPPNTAEQALGFAASDFEYIELRNTSSEPLDLTGVRFTAGADFEFPSGFTLPAGAPTLVVANRAAFEQRYGLGLPIAGSFYPARLDNNGETIRLVYGATILREFRYDNAAPWPDVSGGRSLVLRSPQTSPDHRDPAEWRPSAAAGGTPGRADGQSFADWKARYGITTDEDDADGDGDGSTAFMEYAAGGDPRVAESDPPIRWSRESLGASLEVSVRRALSASEAGTAVAISEDLRVWTPANALLSRRSVSAETEALTYSVPLQGQRLFLRVVFSKR